MMHIDYYSLLNVDRLIDSFIVNQLISQISSFLVVAIVIVNQSMYHRLVFFAMYSLYPWNESTYPLTKQYGNANS